MDWLTRIGKRHVILIEDGNAFDRSAVYMPKAEKPSERLTLRLTPSQYRAFVRAMDGKKQSDELREAIRLYCETADVEWPDDVVEHGGDRKSVSFPPMT